MNVEEIQVEDQDEESSLVNLPVELAEAIIHSLYLSWNSVINSLSAKGPVVASENLDIEVDY